MREDLDLVQWASQQAVVALPVHMDASNAGRIRAELLSAINGGATALIADVTATTSCDHVGADVDHLVPVYPSLEAAPAASPPAEALAVMAGPGLGGSRSWGGSTVGHGR